MRIYLTHSSGYDYENELYVPLKQVDAKYEIYFPHDAENNGQNSKDVISSSDIVLAEVSYPSTGQGIELGWAESRNIPIVCVYRNGMKPSSALGAVSEDFIEYSSSEDLLKKVQSILESKSSKLVH